MRKMATYSDPDEALTSYANPNYEDNLYSEVDITHQATPEKQRKKYAQIDLTSMGINPTWNETNGGRDEPLDMYSTVQFTEHSGKADMDDGNDTTEDVSLGQVPAFTPDSTDSGIQPDTDNTAHGSPNTSHGAADEGSPSTLHRDASYKHGPVTDDIYAVVEKRPSDKKPDVKDRLSQRLPSGWERHEDEDGAYYWHTRSGTVQREPPSPVEEEPSEPELPPKMDLYTDLDSSEENPLKCFEKQALKIAEETLQTLSLESESSVSAEPKGVRYAVRSLGWVAITETDLTPENSSKAVNRCITYLSGGKRDINDAIGRWGDGKDLYMDINSSHLRLITPIDCTELNSQAISSIRVWGVGRDNSRDFAYVARDRETRQHMCHVFRCDTPAKHIANTLRDICKQIIMDRNQQSSPQGAPRPTDLPNLNKLNEGQQHSIDKIIKNATFPTPMEEPKKVVKCHYLGTATVHRPAGIDVLNQAIERVHAKVYPEKWVFVDVAIAPSTITISEHKKADNVLAECRVRFLSFMGIAESNVKLMGFIVHTAVNQFICHVFHCEPSSGALCKTIEAACKLRYQKCLDAHGPSPESLAKKDVTKKGIGATLKQGVQSVLDGIGVKKKSKT